MTGDQFSLRRPALIVVDVQAGFDDTTYWGPRDNPDCEANIADLVHRWREREWPVVFVRHDSTDLASPLHPDAAGNRFKEILRGTPDLLVHKQVNSSFHGTPDLQAWLLGQSIDEVVVCGITTNHCCETTARLAGNLGHKTVFVIDATHTFDRVAPDGEVITATVLSRITATNLDGEFAAVVTTSTLLEAI